MTLSEKLVWRNTLRDLWKTKSDAEIESILGFIPDWDKMSRTIIRLTEEMRREIA